MHQPGIGVRIRKGLSRGTEPQAGNRIIGPGSETEASMVSEPHTRGPVPTPRPVMVSRNVQRYRPNLRGYLNHRPRGKK